MTRRERERPQLLTRGFWVMMALAVLSFMTAAAVVSLGARRLAAQPASAARVAPLAGGARDAKRASPDPSLGPP